MTAQRRRIAGLGVAAPFQLWNWATEIGAPAARWTAWREFDSVAEESPSVCALPVTLCNDATSACAAEFFFGERAGAIAISFTSSSAPSSAAGSCSTARSRSGRTGNAGALGSMPVARDATGAARRSSIACASIYQLERRLDDAGRRPLLDLGVRPTPGTISARRSTPGSRKRRTRSPTPRSPRSRSSTSRRSSSTARCRRRRSRPSDARGRGAGLEGARPARPSRRRRSSPGRSAPTRARSAARRCRW